ncbi:aldehyde dehydrogenase family protein [Catenuloplanes indicus]|uniref:Acyl-CoA reductase-like NAD-dependent aldehyde dehydrogenase n=1 Tax=Catenuloplanes indicus TaxID=137267 RepID=A0AAE4B284_9ACTN|nr:aldehyde dehydrogenase family protein [Catenuloplanes indicus]MDQ0371387.1 acyl-CoA reductase-like NAD-dependent aldehyde dehydrogenase [Catenuloplanes indicus]
MEDIRSTIAALGHLVDGRIVRNDATFPVENPATRSPIGDCPDATGALVGEAVAAAKRAQPGWYAAGEQERRRVIGAMAEALTARLESVVAVSALEKGATGGAIEAYGGPAFLGHHAAAPLPVDVIEDNDERLVRVVRKPVGVVAAITPWNSPILTACVKVAGALLAGNTVVLKPSPFTPFATLLLGEIWKDVVPPGVVNIVAGGDDAGRALVAHPDIALISFTGSVEAGRHIAAAAAPALKRVVLELGGNDAAIVLPDVDVDLVAAQLFTSSMIMSGQVCAAVKRLYVHESIYPRMVEALARLADAATPVPESAGGSFGPVSTRPQFERVRLLLDDALTHGAKPANAGARADEGGYFQAPMILTGVRPGMRVVDEEQFGPLLPVLSFRDVDEAIAAANDTPYGLCGSVWTSDIAAGERLAARLECGTAYVNTHAEVAPHIPFGGVKDSGIGRECGTAGVDGYAELQTQYVYKKPSRVLASGDRVG